MIQKMTMTKNIMILMKATLKRIHMEVNHTPVQISFIIINAEGISTPKIFINS